MPIEFFTRDDWAGALRGKRRIFAAILALASVYVLAAQLGSLFALGRKAHAMAVWPPAGIGLAAVLLLGVRIWPGICSGAFLASFWGYFANEGATFAPYFAASLGIAIGSTLQAVVAAELMQKYAPVRSFLERVRWVFSFVAISLSSCLIAATIEAASLRLSGLATTSAMVGIWWMRWLGGACGMLLFAPLLLSRTSRPSFSWRDIVRAALMLLLISGVSFAVFGGVLPERQVGPKAYLVFPFLVWAAVRFGHLGATTSGLVVSGIAIWGTVHGSGPFFRQHYEESLLLLQVFIGVASSTTLVIAATLSERRAVEKRLHASERRYRALFQATPQVVWTAGTRQPDSVAWWMESTGQKVESVGDMGWLNAIHPDDRERVRAKWERACRTQELYEVEYRLRSRDGTYRHTSVRGVALCDSNGKFEEWIGTQIDIDDRKKAEEQLREWNATLERRVAERTKALEESEQRFRAIFHTQFQFIGLLATDGTTLEANRAALAASGLSEQTVIGKTFWETPWWTHDADQQRRLREAVGLAAKGQQDRFEASHPTPEGSLIWVDFSITPFFDEAGRVAYLIPEGRDITQRKQIERDLEEKTQILETIVESMGDAVLVCAPDGKVILRNRAYRQLHKYPGPLAPDVQWSKYLGLRLPRAKTFCPIEILPMSRALRGEATDDMALEIVEENCPLGIAVSVTGRPLINAKGIAGGVVVIRDVSARKAAEEAMRVREELFRSSFENAATGMALVSPEGRYLQVNRAMCELVGYGERELLATDFQTLTHADDLGIDLVHLRKMLAGEIPTYQVEKRYFHKQGHIVHVLLSTSLVRDSENRPLYFVSQIQDITQRKKAEEALRASEAQYRSVVESLAEGVVVQDSEGAIVTCNQRACDILGLSREQIAGRSSLDPAWQSIRENGLPFHGSEHPAMLALRSGKSVFETIMGVRKPTGELRWLTVNAVPIRRSDAATSAAVVASFHDITESRRLNERVRASLGEKEILLKEIHHRVKNNLQIVSTLLDLQSDQTSDERTQEMFQESRGRVKSMALIHERLYRSEDLAGVNFIDYTRQLADDLYRAYKVSDDIRLELQVDVPPLPIDVAIPCGLLLNELMSNCFKHAFKSVDEGCICVSLTSDGSSNLLVVSDDGVGFPADLDFRNAPSFGLQLVHTLVDQLNGSVSLTSERGTEFTIRFPQPNAARVKGIPQ